MITEWSCIGVDASTTNCTVTASTSVAEIATTTPIFSHDEALLIVMIMIVLLSIPFFRFLFSWGK